MINQYITAKEVAQQIGTSDRTGYRIVSQLNAELKEKGYITIPGRCPRRYFLERTYLTEKAGE